MKNKLKKTLLAFLILSPGLSLAGSEGGPERVEQEDEDRWDPTSWLHTQRNALDTMEKRAEEHKEEQLRKVDRKRLKIWSALESYKEARQLLENTPSSFEVDSPQHNEAAKTLDRRTAAAFKKLEDLNIKRAEIQSDFSDVVQVVGKLRSHVEAMAEKQRIKLSEKEKRKSV